MSSVRWGGPMYVYGGIILAPWLVRQTHELIDFIPMLAPRFVVCEIKGYGNRI